MENIGHVRFTKIKERKDGSANVTVEYDDTFKNLVKKLYGFKRLTAKRLEKVIIDALKAGIKEEK